MNEAEFVQLREQCTQSLQVWIAEATRTCEMLGHCLSKPLTLEERSQLHQQRSPENEAQDAHMRHRHELFALVRTGYQESDLLYGVLPEKTPRPNE